MRLLSPPPLFLSVGPHLSPQLCPGTFICHDALSAQLLALTFPSPNSATGPHILHQSRIHFVRAQTNPLRVVHADTHRCCGLIFFHLHTGTYAIFRINSGEREVFSLSLDHAQLLPGQRNQQKKRGGGAALPDLRLQPHPGQATSARFGCCGKLRVRATWKKPGTPKPAPARRPCLGPPERGRGD